jgi:ankyrin
MGYTDIIMVLLNHGVDVNEMGEWGESALHWAAVRGHIEAVKILLDQNANVNAQTINHTHDLNNLMIREGNLVERELRRFRQRQEQDMARSLGTSIQVAGILRLAFAKGDTPLHAAACWNYIDIVKLLISNGADVNRTNNLGQTPSHYSVAFRHYDITQILLNSGADPNIKTSDGMTAAAIARRFGDRQLKRLVAE